jgi:hypothetical protein
MFDDKETYTGNWPYSILLELSNSAISLIVRIGSGNWPNSNLWKLLTVYHHVRLKMRKGTENWPTRTSICQKLIFSSVH